MRNLSITTKNHPQSGKPVMHINILGQEFIYADKRGHSMSAGIDYDFALKVIDSFPVKMSSSTYERPATPICFMDRLSSNPAQQIVLKWHYFGKNRYELLIHCMGHVWTSDVITI